MNSPNNHIRQQPKTPYPHLMSPDQAWQLWNRLQNLSDSLWNIFEHHFLDKCMDTDPWPTNNHTHPMPDETIH